MSGGEQLSEQPPAVLRFVPLALCHLDEVLIIEQEAYPEPWTRGMFLQDVESPFSHFYVAYLGEAMAGYVGFWRVADEAHITSVTIRKEMRGRGFGKQLMAHIMQTASELGLRWATLEVRKSNYRAQQLYLKTGFEPMGVRKGYYVKTREDAIVMARSISARAAAEGAGPPDQGTQDASVDDPV